LRQCGMLMQYMSCSVLGFGKIGRSVAHHLLLRGIKPAVIDINAIRRVQAHNLLCETPEREVLLRQTDVLFSATGSQSLNLLDFRNLKPGCFVFSVTSSDDEFNTKFLDADYLAEKVSQHVWRYARRDHHFYLVNQGNAVNFIHNAVLGSFIHLVRAEMVFAGACLIRHEFKNGIFCLTPDQRKFIAQAWLDTFNAGRHLSTHFEIRDKTSSAGFFEFA
jgi:adenosylhomocysteinase